MARKGDSTGVVGDLAFGVLLALGGWWAWSRFLKTSSRVVATGDSLPDPLESLRRLFNPQGVAPGTGSAQRIPAVQRDASSPGVLYEGPINPPVYQRYRGLGE